MNSIQIDAIYDAFVASVPESLRATAVDLPHVLRLAPEPGVRFSQVFSHEVTLGAPFLIAEAFPGLAPELVRGAGMAHALAVIEAFGTDRIADGQVEESPELSAVLQHLRAERGRALERVWPGGEAQAEAADAVTRAAIAEERELLRRATPMDFGGYARVSLGKQAVGFPAAVALARAAGASSQALTHVELALAGTWLGLQFEDDVVDWEDDWGNGGAWVVNLARGMRARARGAHASEPELVRTAVLGTDVLHVLLGKARRRYRAAEKHARALGALRLARWAGEREVRLRGLIALEERFAGYSVRVRKLSGWAAEILA
jgi:hypothetical protein